MMIRTISIIVGVGLLGLVILALGIVFERGAGTHNVHAKPLSEGAERKEQVTRLSGLGYIHISEDDIRGRITDEMKDRAKERYILILKNRGL